MSFWGRAGLLAVGAAAGYLASRRGPQILAAGQDLVVRSGSDMTRSRDRAGDASGGTMARFWASGAAAPLRAGALKAVRFAATVRQGMQEREAELNEKYAQQRTDLRPGSLDGWDAPEASVGPGGSAPEPEIGTRRRATEETALDRRGEARDADLPEEFFRGAE